MAIFELGWPYTERGPLLVLKFVDFVKSTLSTFETALVLYMVLRYLYGKETSHYFNDTKTGKVKGSFIFRGNNC